MRNNRYFISQIKPIRICILILLLALTLFAPPLFADGEPLAWRGHNLAPVDNDSIRMSFERLVITLSPMWAEVGVDFIFQNDGEACQEIMGFPAAGWRESPIRDFQVWVDGRPVELQYQDEPFTDHLYYWNIAFPKDGQHRVRVRYLVSRSLGASFDSLYEDAFLYILSTGRRWKGPIGRLEIEIKLLDMSPDQVTSLAPSGFKQTPTGFSFVQDNYEPEENLLISFHPSTLKILHKNASGGDAGYCGYPPLVRGKTALISSKIFYFGQEHKPVFDAASQTYTVRRGPLQVRCQVGSTKAFLGDTEIILSAAPELRGDEVMLPLELADPLGKTALFKPHTKELFLRDNRLNYDIYIDPAEYQPLHRAPRRCLTAEYQADLQQLSRKIKLLATPDSIYDALFQRADIYYYLNDWENAANAYAAAHAFKTKHNLTGPDWAHWWQAKSLRLQEDKEESLNIFAHLALEGCRDSTLVNKTFVALAALEAAYSVDKHAGYHWRPSGNHRRLAISALQAAEQFADQEYLPHLRVQLIRQLAKLRLYFPAQIVLTRLLASGDTGDEEFLQALDPLCANWLFRHEGRTLGDTLVAALKDTPSEERFLLQLARTKIITRKLESLEHYERLFAHFPASERRSEYLREIAAITKRLHGEEAYKEKCWQLIQQYPNDANDLTYVCDQEDQLRWIVANLPNPSNLVLLRLAEIDYWQGNYASALRLCRSAGVGGDLRDMATAQSTLLYAFCQLQLGDKDAAAKTFAYISSGESGDWYQEILDNGPDCEAAYLSLSNLHRGGRDCQPQREILHRGLTIHPHSARLYHALGDSFFDEQKYSISHEEPSAQRTALLSALEAYTKASELAADSAENNRYLLSLSKTYAALAKLEENTDRKIDYCRQAILHWMTTLGLHHEQNPYKYRPRPGYLDPALSYLQKKHILP